VELDEVQPERLDLGQYTVECRPIQKPGEQRVSTFQLRNHAWESRQRRRAEIAIDSDRVQIRRVIHTCMLRARSVRPHHQDLVIRASVSDAGGKQAQFSRTLNCYRAIARIELTD
jgi:hypothetical protein